MPIAIAHVLAAAIYVYAGLGVAFALLVLPRRILRIDAGLVGAPIGVRLLIAPGVVALWPLLVRRWLFPRASARRPS